MKHHRPDDEARDPTNDQQPAASPEDNLDNPALRSVARALVSISAGFQEQGEFFRALLAHDDYITGLTFEHLWFFYWHGSAFAVVTTKQRSLATRIPESANNLPIPPHLAEWKPRGAPIDNWRTHHDGTPSHWLPLALHGLEVIQAELSADPFRLRYKP